MKRKNKNKWGIQKEFSRKSGKKKNIISSISSMISNKPANNINI